MYRCVVQNDKESWIMGRLRVMGPGYEVNDWARVETCPVDVVAMAGELSPERVCSAHAILASRGVETICHAVLSSPILHNVVLEPHLSQA